MCFPFTGKTVATARFTKLMSFVGNFVGSFVFAIAFLAQPPAARAESNDAIDIGHNLTPTTNMMPAGRWTVGNYAVAYAPSNSLFIATSPWIWVNYNSFNLHLKWAPPMAGPLRFGLFGSYFESLRRAFVGDAPYYWKSASLIFLASQRWDEELETFVSLRTSYYWNDDRPYSIRMDAGSDAIRGQIDLTTLTRLQIDESDFSIGFEFGTVGLNYLYPYIHLGTSVLYKSGPWLLQVGFSYSIQWRELRESKGLRPGRIDSRVRQSPDDGQFYFFPYETALHPEMQLQYFF